MVASVKHYLQSHLPAAHHCRSVVQLTAQDAVHCAVAVHGLQLLLEPLPLCELGSQLAGERGHVGRELLQNAGHFLQSKQTHHKVSVY